MNKYSSFSKNHNRMASIKFLCVVQHFNCRRYVLGVSVYSKGKFMSANVLYVHTQCYSPFRQSEPHGSVTDVCYVAFSDKLISKLLFMIGCLFWRHAYFSYSRHVFPFQASYGGVVIRNSKLRAVQNLPLCCRGLWIRWRRVCWIFGRWMSRSPF